MHFSCRQILHQISILMSARTTLSPSSLTHLFMNAHQLTDSILTIACLTSYPGLFRVSGDHNLLSLVKTRLEPSWTGDKKQYLDCVIIGTYVRTCICTYRSSVHASSSIATCCENWKPPCSLIRLHCSSAIKFLTLIYPQHSPFFILFLHIVLYIFFLIVFRG